LGKKLRRGFGRARSRKEAIEKFGTRVRASLQAHTASRACWGEKGKTDKYSREGPKETYEDGDHLQRISIVWKKEEGSRENDEYRRKGRDLKKGPARKNGVNAEEKGITHNTGPKGGEGTPVV